MESNDIVTPQNAGLRELKPTLWSLTENTLRLAASTKKTRTNPLEPDLIERLLEPDQAHHGHLPYARGLGYLFWDLTDSATLNRLSEQYDRSKDVVQDLYDLLATNAVPTRALWVLKGNPAFQPYQQLLTGEDPTAMVSYGFCPLVARLNHACQPNAMLTYLTSTTPPPPQGDGMEEDAFFRPRTVVQVVALQPITKDEEITISYIAKTPITSIRTELWSRFWIRCRCPTCRTLCGELYCMDAGKNDYCPNCHLCYCSSACKRMDWQHRHQNEHRHPITHRALFASFQYV